MAAARDPRDVGVPVLQSAPAALVASMTGVFLSAPLDLLKTRAQLARSSPTSASLSLSTTTIYSPSSAHPPLWTGAGLALARVPLYAATQSLCFSWLLSTLHSDDGDDAAAAAPTTTSSSSFALFCTAAVSSQLLATVVAHPLEVWKTRRMGSSHSGAAAATAVAGVGGVARAFLGLRVALASFFVAHVSAATFHYMHHRYSQASATASPALPLPTSAVNLSGALPTCIGVVSLVTVATHPLDTLMRRLQCNEPWKVARTRSLWPGLSMAMARNVALMSLQVGLYEPLLHATSAWYRLKA